MNARFLGLICGAAAIALVPAHAGSAMVSGAWFRSLPGNVPAGGYFSVMNMSNRPLVLTGAVSSGCGSLELHMTHNMGGMMHMMAVPKVEIAAGATFAFAPGGYHLMCMSPKLKIGTSVPVTLKFAQTPAVTADFTVRGPTSR